MLLLAMLLFAGGALGNGSHRGRRLEATTVGLMIGIGRVGQVAALSLTGVLVGAGVSKVGLLGVAGGGACMAAVLAMVARRHVRHTPAT